MRILAFSPLLVSVVGILLTRSYLLRTRAPTYWTRVVFWSSAGVAIWWLCAVTLLFVQSWLYKGSGEPLDWGPEAGALMIFGLASYVGTALDCLLILAWLLRIMLRNTPVTPHVP